jgi:hypothetical protein
MAVGMKEPEPEMVTPVRVNFEAAGRQPDSQAIANFILRQRGWGRLACFSADWPEWCSNLPVGMTYWS